MKVTTENTSRESKVESAATTIKPQNMFMDLDKELLQAGLIDLDPPSRNTLEPVVSEDESD